jgi:LacI family transcriptional regulator
MAAASDAVADLLTREQPDAIFALNDLMAVAATHAVTRAGLRVPEDVAVVGYDDMEYAAFHNPPLTSVRLPYRAMGEAAMQWLAEAIHGRAAAPLRRTFAPELIVRGSS